jgi:hypothetical protein
MTVLVRTSSYNSATTVSPPLDKEEAQLLNTQKCPGDDKNLGHIDLDET